MVRHIATLKLIFHPYSTIIISYHNNNNNDPPKQNKSVKIIINSTIANK